MKKWFVIAATLLATAAVVLVMVRPFEPAPTPGEPFGERPDTIAPAFRNLDNYLSMFTLVRDALTAYPDVQKALAIPVDPDLPDLCDRPVLVSIYRENTPPLWGVGTENCLADLGLEKRTGCLHDAILCATYQITMQEKIFKKFYGVKLDQVAVRVDVLDRARLLKSTKKNIKKDNVEPGVHGLILQNGSKLTFQPPFSYLIYSWETDDHSRQGRLRRQLNYLADDAGVRDWSDYPIYRFNAHSVLQHRPDFMPLIVLRDAPIIKRFGSREIGRAAIDSGRYLNATFDFHQKRFRYIFNPVTLERSSFLEYETVHHAGAVHALFKLYKASHKEEFFDMCQASFDFLVRHISPPLLEPDLLAVKRLQVTQLGSTALTLLALTELPDKLVDMIGVDRINRLARFLVEMQEKDGRFYDFYWQRLLGYMPRTPVPSFQGEAFFALTRYYKANANVEWLLAARHAAERLIAQYRRDGRVDPWTLQGMVELYDIDPNPEYAEIAFAMASELLGKQYGDPTYKRPPYPDYHGGFNTSRPPRTLTAARRVEALLAVHWLAYRLGKDTKPYTDAIMRGTHFLLQNQYRRDNTYYVNLPEATRGAFRGGLIDPAIRVDFNQHAIIALTGAYDLAYMQETGRVPDEFQAEGTGRIEDTLEMGGKAGPTN
jgi:hypothetical protein